MPSKKPAQDKGGKHRYYSLHPLRFAWAIGAFGVMKIADWWLGFGSAGDMAALLVGAGMFFIIPPVRAGENKITNELREKKRLAQAEADLAARSHNLEIVKAINELEAKVLPRITNTGVAADSKNVVNEVRWLEQRWLDMVNKPEHMATVKNIATMYLPETLELALKNQADRNRSAIASTRESLGILDRELTRIKSAVLNNRLSELESHEEALRRQFNAT